jgi:CPA2 family monovalent cation:H+ antiporter-2
MELVFLKDIIIIFGLAIVVILSCRLLRIPTLVALLITGVICGPNALGIIENSHEVEFLAEVGIAFLLFSIGIELSLRRFLQGMKQILIGGGIQVSFTLLSGMAIALILGRPIGEAIFLGCLLSLSSTAIVVSLLQEKGEITTPAGRLAVSILVFQDIIVVPMILIVPILAGSSIKIDARFGMLIAEAIGILSFVLFSGYWLVPKLLRFVARTKDKRLFLLTVLFICFSVAWLTSSLGLSFALGAFLSGLIISESEYNYHTLGNVFPFQQIFTCFFFVSMGMLLEGTFVLQNPLLILAVVIGIISLKASIVLIVALVMGHSFATSLITALALCQVGEFSFLLIKSGIINGISTPFHYQLFLAATLLSMAVTPLLIHLAPILLRQLQVSSWFSFSKAFDPQINNENEELSGHVVVIGFGCGGHNLVYSLKTTGVPYLVLEVDPHIVQKERLKGEPVFFGDASFASDLANVNIKTASILAVVINDEAASRLIITNARHANPNLHIIVRTRHVSDIKQLKSLGANEVVPEELEASIEVFTRVMRKCLVSNDEIDKITRNLRSGEYELSI